MVAVLYANSTPETSLSYNRLNVSYFHLKSDASSIDVSSDGALVKLQLSPVELLYFNVGGAFESAEADDFNIDGKSLDGLLGIGTYLPIGEIIHLNIGVDGTYGQGDIQNLDFDSWSVIPYVGLRIGVLTNLEVYGSVGYSFGELKYDDINVTEDTDGASGNVGVIFGLTDNFALTAAALFAEDIFGGEVGIQFNF